jgi:hypothetical protein
MRLRDLRPGMVVWRTTEKANRKIKSVHRSSSWFGGGYAFFGGKEKSSPAILEKARKKKKVART